MDLVSQIPALIISTAAGILVSRSGSENRMGQEFAVHLFSTSTPIYIGSAVVFCMGLVPGLPSIPFMGLGVALATGAWYFLRPSEGEDEEEAEAAAEAEGEDAPGRPLKRWIIFLPWIRWSWRWGMGSFLWWISSKTACF